MKLFAEYKKQLTVISESRKLLLIAEELKLGNLKENNKKLLLELTAKEEFILLELLVPIRNLEKDPTPAELELLQPHPSLVQALRELQPSSIDLVDPALLNSNVEFQLELPEELVEKVDDSSDAESYKSDRSIDSIARNADFISFD
jgi:hypothetical protein